MHLLQNRVHLHALVNTVMNTLVPKPQRKFLTAKETIKFASETAGRIVEKREINLMSLVLLFHNLMLIIFRLY